MFSAILHPWDDILDVILALSAFGFVISYAYAQWKGGFSKVSADAVIAYKAELEAVKCSLDRMQEENKLKDQRISALQGQIDVLKEVPLVNIDNTLKELSKFNKGLMDINIKILERLDNDAVVLARNTKSSASAVEHVKTDLKNGK